jgi:phytoene dehydrogenase-like protein
VPAAPNLDLPKTDVVIVGSGPNGLAAAIRMAQAGQSVLVLEAAETPGGGARSAELTLPAFVHDICSAVYPLTVCSPFFRTLPLEQHGLQWVYPTAALAHPFDDGSAALLYQSIDQTAATLGEDARGYQRLMTDSVEKWKDLLEDILAPLRLPRHAFFFARFGLRAIRSARALAHAYFRREPARTLFAGLAAHAMVPLENLTTAGVGIMLAVLGHAAGWPFARGGAQQLADALVSHLRSLGGEIITGCRVESLDQLPPARAILLDLTPKQLLAIAGNRLPDSYRHKLERYRYGMGAFKMDWALHQPIPWRARECAQAGTVHLGGSFDEISRSERAAWNGRAPERPFVLLSQPSLFDSTRAPAGKHTAWGYCHVPHAYSGDAVGAIEDQIERFAPGFRDCVLARSIMSPADLEKHNPNLVGGDIGGGAALLSQLFFRPTASMYRTPIQGVYLCSSSTPPGAGVHGMCGFFAAEAALMEQKKGDSASH